MFHRTPHHNSINCILSPSMMDSIILNGNSRRRQRALRTLQITSTLNVARVGHDEGARMSRQAMRAERRLKFASPWGRRKALAGNENRTISDAHHTQRIGNQVRAEGEPDTGDPAVDEAYKYMGNTYDFYWQVFARDSIDDAGMALNGTVHYGRDYDNAFWDGRRMNYGDGDGEQFERFTKSVDVIGHELTHGVTQFEAGLIYWDQSGALNESISDVFGSLVKQFVNNQTADRADWLIGAELFVPGAVNGVAIRSMKAPGTAYDDPVLGKDPQPDNMRKYVKTFQDSRGVHINSGIPNKAFYEVSVNLGGYAWEKAGRIWYATLQSPLLRPVSNFQNFARLTIMSAQQLFPGAGGLEVQAVRDGWAQVGINV